MKELSEEKVTEVEVVLDQIDPTDHFDRQLQVLLEEYLHQEADLRLEQLRHLLIQIDLAQSQAVDHRVGEAEDNRHNSIRISRV